MSCALATLLLCLDLSGIYIDGSLAALDSGAEHYRHDTSTIVILDHGWVRSTSFLERNSSTDRAQNPYGRIAIGYEQPLYSPNLRLSAEIYHESSVDTARDRGVNGARINLRWYPFGGAR